MKFMFFSIKYRYNDILFKKHKLHSSRFGFCCNRTCHCVNMVSVTSASRYHPRYQNRSSISIRGLIPRNWPRSFRLVQSINAIATSIDYLSEWEIVGE